MAQTEEEARNLVWVFLGHCTSLDPSLLKGYQVKEDWFVQVSSDSVQEFGLWKVDTKSGIIEPQDPLARAFRDLVDSECAPDILAGAFPPTPTALADAQSGAQSQPHAGASAYRAYCYAGSSKHG